ncbi:MAG: GHKL domain-containing protein [Clostridia bacterium]|nr:GHKL domain-containing protein [Clostridia bacterium]
MEILNNIWTAISTPNENLIGILSIFFMIFIEAPLTFEIVSSLFNINYVKKQKYLYIIITSSVAIINALFIPRPFNIIFNYIFAFIIIYFIFKMNIVKTVVASVFPSIFFMMIEKIIINPYLNLLNITYIDAQVIPIYRILYASIFYSIIYILILIIKYKNITLNIIDNFNKKDKFIILLNLVFGLFSIIVQVFLITNYTDILPFSFTFFNIICLLIYFGLSLYSLIKIIKLFTTTQKLESVEEYNKTLHILHDSVRGFKHDFDNIVTTIGGYIKTNDMEGLSKYYSQLEEDCSKVSNLYILNPDIINNPGVYSLLTTKYSEAEGKGIKINLTFLLDLNELHMKIYDFTRILGILLDNAIEATSECDEKVLNIDFRNEAKNNRNIILIENTYKDKDVDIDNIFNKGISGKENHSGLGLWEIRQILKKNNNINLHTTKNDKYFSQQLEIYY